MTTSQGARNERAVFGSHVKETVDGIYGGHRYIQNYMGVAQNERPRVAYVFVFVSIYPGAIWYSCLSHSPMWGA